MCGNLLRDCQPHDRWTYREKTSIFKKKSRWTIRNLHFQHIEIEGSSEKSSSCLKDTDVLEQMNKCPQCQDKHIQGIQMKDSQYSSSVLYWDPGKSSSCLRDTDMLVLHSSSLRETGAGMRETTSSVLRVNSQGRSFIEVDPGIEKVNVARGCK